jgi:GTP-binding protein YchF
MQLGIIGLPKVGKTTLFNALTATHQDTDKFVASKKTHIGVAKVIDRRLEKLRDLFEPKSYVPATTEYVDIPGMEKGDGSAKSGKEGLDLDKLRSVDALVHVVRAFADDEILHASGKIDPAGDIATIDLELILADYEVIERRLQKLEQSKKRGLNDAEKRELAVLQDKILPAVEAERPLREVELTEEEHRRLRGFGFLSQKPLLVVINVGEEEAAESSPDATEDLGVGNAVQVLSACAKIEDEVAQLDAAEQPEFLQELGLGEPSVVRILRASYELLGLISFFTVGEDEVRAWTIRRGTTAKGAAGAVHSDIERGFIRAEVVGWQDLIALGSIAACRDKGILRLEGKEYPVQDGEVVHFRFNV